MSTLFVTKFPELYVFYKIDFNYPSRNLRDDIKLIPLAIAKGFTVKEGKTFWDTNTFHKGNKVIWFCRRGWACAEVIDNLHSNHRYYDDLSEALNTE